MNGLDNYIRKFYTSGSTKCEFPLIQKTKEEKMHANTMQTIGRQSI
jgi:hypothetical protein